MKAGRIKEKGTCVIKDNKVIMDWVQFKGGYPDQSHCIICGNLVDSSKTNWVELSFLGEVIAFTNKNEWITMPYSTGESQGEWEVGNECFKQVVEMCMQVINNRSKKEVL